MSDLVSSRAGSARVGIALQDGRVIWGRLPGASAVTVAEHQYRDELARQVRGITEAALPFGRADVMTDRMVFEVEAAENWRHAVRQVLAYFAQCDLSPSVALFGPMSRDGMLKIRNRLNSGSYEIGLWWHSGDEWLRISSNKLCQNLPRDYWHELYRQQASDRMKKRWAERQATRLKLAP